METRTSDLLFGTGRTAADLRGTFAPGEREKGAVLSTFRGWDLNGKGRESFLRAAERVNLVTAEQRVAGGPVGAAGEGAGETVRSLVGDGGAAGVGAAAAGQQYANPVYNGLFAQHLMRTQGFVPPSEPPVETVVRLADGAASAAPAGQAAAGGADASGTVIASAADDIATGLAAQEQRLVESFRRLAQLPDDAKVPALARALDATAAAGHGGDAFDVLGQALASRPLGAAAAALDDSVEVALRAAPVADDLSKAADDVSKVAAPIVGDVAAVAAPVADDVAKAAAPIVDDVVTSAVPQVVEAALPQVVARASATQSLLLGSDDALRGLMPFAAGVDDTLRLLARV